MTRVAPHPFRDELAAARERGERLARENTALRMKLRARGFDAVQWALVGVIASCGTAVAYVLSA